MQYFRNTSIATAVNLDFLKVLFCMNAGKDFPLAARQIYRLIFWAGCVWECVIILANK